MDHFSGFRKVAFCSGRKQFKGTTKLPKYSNLVNKSGFVNEVCICKNMSRCTNKKMWKSPSELYGHRNVVGIAYLLERAWQRKLHRDVIRIDVSSLSGSSDNFSEPCRVQNMFFRTWLLKLIAKSSAVNFLYTQEKILAQHVRVNGQSSSCLEMTGTEVLITLDLMSHP